MKQRKGTYYEIDELSKRLDKLEKTIEKFMSNWGPEIQKKRDERDSKWDEMIRVLTVQERNKR